MVVFVGSSADLTPTEGVAPFVFKPTPSGYLDTSTGIYTLPPAAEVVSEVVEATDAEGKEFSIKVQRKGFSPKQAYEMPQAAFMDQNYVTDGVWLGNGDVLVTAIGSDYEGERWATYRSSDSGQSWARVDQFMGYSYMGESHPMAMTASGSNVFVCGYAYTYDSIPGKPNQFWYVRKSGDGGSTWTTSDEWYEEEFMNYWCGDVAVSPVTGYIYAIGWADFSDGTYYVIRESKNNGDTWNTVVKEPVSTHGFPVQMDFKPNGDILVVTSMGASAWAGNFTPVSHSFSGGVWNSQVFTNTGLPINSAYQIKGTLKVQSNTVAYYAFKSGSSGRIMKTTDGGQTWSTVYTGLTGLQGFTITASGNLIAAGGDPYYSNANWSVVISTDNGATWTRKNLETMLTPPEDTEGVVVVSHPTLPRVLTTSFDLSSHTAVSLDDGATWSLGGDILFEWAFWSSVWNIIETTSGKLLAILDSGDMVGDWPLYIADLSSGNVNVIFSEKPAAASYNYQDMIQGHDSALYSLHTEDNNIVIRRSTNEGTSWTEVHRITNTYLYSNDTRFIRNTDTSTQLIYTNSSNEIVILETLNGTNWVQKTLLPLAGGYTTLRVKQVFEDANGNIYIAQALGTASTVEVVVIKSTDQGSTFSEIYRSTVTSAAYFGEVFLKIAPNGELYIYNSLALFKSVDQGQSWTAVSNVPAGTLFDIMWDGDKKIFMHGYISISRETDTPGVFLLLDSQSARTSLGEAKGKYDYEIYGKKFKMDAKGNPYIIWTYNDPYKGSRTEIMKLVTSN